MFKQFLAEISLNSVLIVKLRVLHFSEIRLEIREIQLEGISSMSRRPQNADSDERNVEEKNMQNRNSRSRINLMEPDDDESGDLTW